MPIAVPGVPAKRLDRASHALRAESELQRRLLVLRRAHPQKHQEQGHRLERA